MNVLKYIFCWVFKRQNTKLDIISSIAMGSMATTLLLMFHIGIIEGLVSKLTNVQIIFFHNETSFLLFFVLYISTIVYFKWGNRYKVECDKMSNYPKIEKLKNVSLLYIIATIILAFIVPIL